MLSEFHSKTSEVKKSHVYRQMINIYMSQSLVLHN